jgi:hypothetical protein
MMQKKFKIHFNLSFFNVLGFTGLNVDVDRILEIACIITDGNLSKTLEVFPYLPVHFHAYYCILLCVCVYIYILFLITFL